MSEQQVKIYIKHHGWCAEPLWMKFIPQKDDSIIVKFGSKTACCTVSQVVWEQRGNVLYCNHIKLDFECWG